MSSQTAAVLGVEQAYAHCRDVARREAKNFYYAFLALPPERRNAMCAMYAFMRRADDISDEESMPIAERRVLMQRWREAFHRDEPFDRGDAAVFTAVRDTQQRFQVSDGLLDELVDGTAMDLSDAPLPGVERRNIAGKIVDVYTTVAALDRYCYLVASVVGLVTIRIFGYKGDQANEDAVRLGKAFQYTNILRDVREDAERARIYLPLELLDKHGANVADVLDAARTQRPSAALLTAMQDLGERAEVFYASAPRLISVLAPQSRGAMRTLVDIYHALLRRIQSVRFQVFGERVRVSTPQKLLFLLRGLVSRSNG